MKKKYLLISLLLIAIGFATVSTTLLINGTTTINKNDSDFKVYYSDTFENGVRSGLPLKSDTEIEFSESFYNLGETYILEYDVTNSSKNYDAELVMTCTGGNEYLSVENEFNTEDLLEATKTRRGKLTLKLVKSYTGSGLTVDIKCTLTANAVERNTLGVETEETCEWIYTDTDESGTITTGDEYQLCDEKFNVTAQDNKNISMLAKLSLDEKYRQNYWPAYTQFALTTTWQNVPGPTDIDIFSIDGEIKTYINNYVDYLKRKSNNSTITGNIMTLKELKDLGCQNITDDYSELVQPPTCMGTQHYSWINNGKFWWIRSASHEDTFVVYQMTKSGQIWTQHQLNGSSIRPLITISKESLGISTEPLDPETFCQSVGYQFGEEYTNSGFYSYADGYYNCSHDDSDMVCYGEVYDENGEYLGPNDSCNY